MAYQKNNNKRTRNPQRSYNNQEVKNQKGTCEYHLAEGIAAEILKKNPDGDVQKILCDYVNTYCGLLKECVKVTLF